MNKVPLSVIILAHQDTPLLRQAVVSCSWAEEVLLITTARSHTSTTDRWQSIPGVTKQLSYPQPLTDFSELRNWSMDRSKNDWVLFVDSDEVVAANAPDVLRPVVTRADISGVYITRQDVFWGQALRWGEAGSMKLLRLLNRQKSQFEGAVHEVAVTSGVVMEIPLIIKHYAHENISSFIAKVAVYSRVVAEERRASGHSFQWWELLLLPPGKFIWNYIFRLGFLDGWRGFIYAVIMSIHSASVRAYLYEQTRS